MKSAYTGEGHGLRGLANRRDLTIRYFQFFDHYLKGAPAPKWMTEERVRAGVSESVARILAVQADASASLDSPQGRPQVYHLASTSKAKDASCTDHCAGSWGLPFPCWRFR